jgi:hypothetical protein
MFSVLLVLAAGAADPAVTSGEGAKAAARPEKRICKFDGDLSSRIARRHCRSAAEWDALEKEAADMLRRRGDRVTTPKG